MFAKIEQSLKMTFQLSWASGFRNVESMNGNERTIVDKQWGRKLTISSSELKTGVESGAAER